VGRLRLTMPCLPLRLVDLEVSDLVILSGESGEELLELYEIASAMPVRIVDIFEDEVWTERAKGCWTGVMAGHL